MKSTDNLVPDSPAVFIISRLFGIRKSLDALCFRLRLEVKELCKDVGIIYIFPTVIGGNLSVTRGCLCFYGSFFVPGKSHHLHGGSYKDSLQPAKDCGSLETCLQFLDTHPIERWGLCPLPFSLDWLVTIS